jgi:hypothetical protein
MNERRWNNSIAYESDHITLDDNLHFMNANKPTRPETDFMTWGKPGKSISPKLRNHRVRLKAAAKYYEKFTKDVMVAKCK